MFQDLDPENEHDLTFVARTDGEAPGEWEPSHSCSVESVKRTVARLQSREKVSKVVLARNRADDIVGFHWVQLDNRAECNIGHVLSLWVHTDYRRCGVATRLKALVETWMREEGVSEVRTQVYLKNERMLALNEKLGFESVMVGMSKTLD